MAATLRCSSAAIAALDLPWAIAAAISQSRVIVSTVALLACLLFTLGFASLFGHHSGGAGSLTWQIIGQAFLYLAGGMVMGLAFGAAILLSAPAIVIYLLLPLIWNALANKISALAPVALWIGVPLAIGIVHIGRGDIY